MRLSSLPEVKAFEQVFPQAAAWGVALRGAEVSAPLVRWTAMHLIASTR
jgi:hypothetical protein